MTRGEQIRFLKDILAVCNTYGVELETCGCDDGLRTLAPKGTDVHDGLFGILVKDGKAVAHTEYLDGEEIEVLSDGTVKMMPYRYCHGCDKDGLRMYENPATGRFQTLTCKTCNGTKRTP